MFNKMARHFDLAYLIFPASIEPNQAGYAAHGETLSLRCA
jgi:hypothetical protein